MVLLLAGFVAVVVRSPAMAGEKGVIGGAEMTGYGRIVLNFDVPVTATARSGNGVMVLEFDHVIDVDIEKLAAQLPAYVSVVRRDPDGKAIRLALVRNLKADIKPAAEKLYIDLLPQSWTGPPPALPMEIVQDLAKRALNAEIINRRLQNQKAADAVMEIVAHAASAPSFNRIVFDLPKPAAVEFSRDGDVVTLLFEGMFKLDVAKLEAILPQSVTAVTAETVESMLKVTLTVPNNGRVAGFQENQSFVVDIPLPKGQVPGRQAVSLSAESSNPPAPKAAEAGETSGHGPSASASEPMKAPEKETETTAAKAAGGDAAAGGPEEGKAAAAVPMKAASALKTVSGLADAQEPILAKGEIGTGQISFDRLADGARVVARFNERPAAAIFQRADVLWMVFEGATNLVSQELPPALRPLIGTTEIDGIGGASIFRLRMNMKKVVSVAPVDKGWTITLGDATQAPIDPISLKRGVSAEGRTVLTADLSNAGRVLWLENSELGERLAVVTSSGKTQALARTQRFVEFTALATSQGLVFQPAVDDLIVRSGLEQVVISRDQGLTLSLGMAPVANSAAKATSGGASLLNLTPEVASSGNGIIYREWELLRAAANSLPRDRSRPRLALARFYFANWMAPESLAVLANIFKDDQTASLNKPLLMLQAADFALAGDMENAVKTLNSGLLQNEMEGKLWRAYVDAKSSRWTPALVGFREAHDVLEHYPEPLQAMFLPLVVEAAIEGRDVSFADQQLEILEQMKPKLRNLALEHLLHGRINEQEGHIDQAMSQYASAKMTQDREVEAKARLYHALLGLKEKRVDPLRAEAELETIAVIWRRNDVELQALGKLAEIYAAGDRWREAFAAARRAQEVLPDHPITRKIYDDMEARFEDLFSSGNSNQLEKVQALALFYDFRNFTPPGRKGDEIVRHLADRLAELDLLDEAAELLRHQVETRLGGAARASVATRLAVLYLQNRKPADALATLRNSRMAVLPEELARARALLEARALSDLSRTDLAIEMIAAQSGPDADRLRADIYWQGKRWREAGEALELVLGNAWQRMTPLTDMERGDVLRAGIAYVLGGERLGLDRLRSKYAARMADSSDARAFELITAESAMKAEEFRELARLIVSSDTLTSFLDSYRKRYPEAAGRDKATSSAVDKSKPAAAAPPPEKGPEAAKG